MSKLSKGVPLAGSGRMRPAESKMVSAAQDTDLVPITLLLRHPPSAPPMPSQDDWSKTPHHQRKFLSVDEYVSTYGATKEDMAAVLAFLSKNNMPVLTAEAATRTISVNCSVASARSAFGIQLNRYESQDPIDKEDATYTHYGYDGEVHVPAEITGIVIAVIGFDDRKVHTKVLSDFTGDPNPSSLLPVSQCAQLYRFPTLPATGPATDVVIGIHAPGGPYLPGDITTYFANAVTGFQTPPVLHDANCVVSGTTFTNGTGPPDAEITLDIQTSTTIAQGCTANIYHTQNSEPGWVAFMNRVLVPLPGEKQPQVLTTSYPLDRGETFVGDPHNSASQAGIMTVLFQALAQQGINVFCSAGDYGSLDRQTDNQAHVQYPASDPWVTAVGGTVIGNVKNGPSGTISDGTFDEYVWSDIGNTASPFFSPGNLIAGATGGGVSALFDRPSYQSSLTVQDSNGKTLTKRAIPDIAGMVGCSGYVVNSSTTGLIGTSITTPMYAGLFAVLRSIYGQKLGPLNDYLYTTGTAFPQAYKDIIVGDNDSGPGIPFFAAKAGWDAATGWGSIIGTTMEDALARLLYPKNFYITIRKNSFGLDEVSGAIAAAGAGSKAYDSFWLVLEGYSPNQLPSKPPTVTSLIFSPGSVEVNVGAPIIEIASLPDTPQRILYPCTVTFFSAAAHPSNDPSTPGVFPPANQSPKASTLVAGINVDGGIEADSEIELTPGANPYFSNVVLNPNGTTAGYYFLSNDLRVFTTAPGALLAGQRPMNDPSSPTFPAGSGTVRTTQSGYSYIQSLLSYLNNAYSNPSGPDPFTLLPGQNNALTSDSSVAPTSNGQVNYNFAIARVRISGPSTKPVKVYFRLFVANSPDTDFSPSTTYRTTNGSPDIGLGVTTIPMFATGNFQRNNDFQVNNDYSQPSSNNFGITGAGDHWAYFGCYLNIYPPDNTIPVNGQNLSVSSQLPGTHHCLVAQIDFPDAAIVPINGMTATPENSDKLAQRNINVTFSDNPGPEDTHLIPQTFDVRPSPVPSDSDPLSYLPDELRIDWGNTPPGSTASIYWPQVKATDVVALSKQLYATRQLSVSSREADTIECIVPAGGSTYVPIPLGSGDNYAGLFTIQLPQGIVRGQEFLLTVDRISSRQPPAIITIRDAPVPKIQSVRQLPTTTNWRYVTGTFAVRVPVAVPSEILPSELDTQAILAWRLNQMSPTNRWYPVLQRYLGYINGRVSGLGYTGPVVPSPNGAPPGSVPYPPIPPNPCNMSCCEHCSKKKCCEETTERPHCCWEGSSKKTHKHCDNSHKLEHECHECSSNNKHKRHPEDLKILGPTTKYVGKVIALTYDSTGCFDGFTLQNSHCEEEHFCGVDPRFEDLLACGSKYKGFGDVFEVTCKKGDRIPVAISVEKACKVNVEKVEICEGKGGESGERSSEEHRRSLLQRIKGR